MFRSLIGLVVRDRKTGREWEVVRKSRVDRLTPGECFYPLDDRDRILAGRYRWIGHGMVLTPIGSANWNAYPETMVVVVRLVEL